MIVICHPTTGVGKVRYIGLSESLPKYTTDAVELIVVLLAFSYVNTIAFPIPVPAGPCVPMGPVGPAGPVMP